MDKLWKKTTFVNNDEPALSADLLNEKESVLDEIDTRVVELESKKAEQKEVDSVKELVSIMNTSLSLLRTESGHSLELNIDENYIMTISLLNKSGETISSKIIDFPIESMVVNASYNSGKLTLILQNGNTVDVDVSSIVRGLVNESRTIAGIDLKDDITADELIAALGIDTIKEDVAQLKGDLVYQKIVDYSKNILLNKVIDSNGDMYKNDIYNVIHMLPVHGFTKIKFEDIALSNTSQNNWAVIGYDKDKNYVKRIDSGTQNWYQSTETCDINEDIYYVSCCYNVSYTPTITGNGIKNLIFQNEEDIKNANLKIDETLYQYIDCIGICSHGIDAYFNSNGKNPQGGYEYYILEVSGEDIVCISTNANSVAKCVVYYTDTPSDSTFISYENYTYPVDYGTAHIKDLILTIPNNAKYIVVNNKLNDGDRPKISIKSYDYLNKNIKYYENKKFLFLGDSITAPSSGFRKYFREIVKPIVEDCTAVVGAHWCDYNTTTIYDGNPQAVGDEQNVIGNQVQKIINNRSNYLDDYDYIFICAGTNDDTIHSDGITNAMINEAYFENGDIRPLENIDRSKLAGATRWVVQKLRELFPTAKIVFTTPINRIDFHMCDRVFDNRKAILTCANAVSVDVCDTTKCGINMYDSTDFSDNLHPNDKGAKKLGEYIANWFIANHRF